MPRGHRAGWKDRRNVPKETPTKPVRVGTGIWYTPAKKFAAYIYVNGADVFIGSFDSVEAAHVAREERKTAIRGGQPVVAQAKSRLRLNDAKELYFAEGGSGWKDSTRRSAKSRYSAHVAEALGDVPLRDLTFERLSTFRKELVEKEGIGGQTRREVLLLVRAILRDCVRRSYIAVNPADLLDLPSKDVKIVTVPPYDVAIAAVAAVQDPMARMVADLILNTGLRINEALGLTWADLDLVARKLIVQRSIDQKSGKIVPPKTSRSIRRIDLPGGFVTRLTAYAEAQQAGAVLRNDPWLFPATERPVEPTSSERPPVLNDRNFTQRHWAPARTKVTPLRFGMHALRHLYATRLLQKGATSPPEASCPRRLVSSRPNARREAHEESASSPTLPAAATGTKGTAAPSLRALLRLRR